MFECHGDPVIISHACSGEGVIGKIPGESNFVASRRPYMKAASTISDRNYWFAMSLLLVSGALFIFANRGPIDSDQRFTDLICSLSSDRPEVKEAATLALQESSISFVPRLLRMIRSGNGNLQAQAVLAFAAMGGHARSAVPQLAQFLRDPSSSQAAARSLAAIGRPALPALTNALNSPLRYVRGNAARGIGLLHSIGRPAIPILVQALEDDDDIVRYFVSRALGQIAEEPAQVVPALLSRLDDRSLDVRKMAILSLARFHENAMPALPALRNKALHGFNQNIRDAAVFALQAVEPTASGPEEMN